MALGLLGGFDPVAGDVELEDDAVMDQAVDGRGGGHRVFEDLFPLAEGQVAGEEHAAAFIAFGQEGEEDLDLIAVLLDVADVIDEQRFIAAEPPDGLGQHEIALGRQQLLDEQAAGRTAKSGVREFNPDYTYVVNDLKRIGALAGSFFLILVALSFILR